MSFAFAIGQSLGRCTPAIGCEIADLGKTVDIADLQHDRHCQDVAERYCQMLCTALGSDPVYFNTVNKLYSFNYHR